ncbi:ribosomal RNA large subunit methyltransferase A [Sporolactobacillus inulinus]|uniref:Ribosomal RNA large subunit methyltransferase A n=1 Tax=Sporolactobacillus inulinus TaxID=2078 RepID=A0A4Y1Z6T9_9BACL|nr:hypothetical protein [Sporolactobacillus inulinus]GAY74704.1 ribosomal RNA large subunit methyltransferase A [Sporolactobacillus inulinus]
MNNKMRCAEKMQQELQLFHCPLCGEAFTLVNEQRSLRCPHAHTFDIAKQGYVNLLTKAVHTHYDKQLFEARRRIIVGHQFFNPLMERIVNDIDKQMSSNMAQQSTILDLGCGEGSHLAAICDALSQQTSKQITGCGIDLAKPGIQLSAKHYPNQIWFVGDLAQPPYQNTAFNFCLIFCRHQTMMHLIRYLNPVVLSLKSYQENTIFKSCAVHFTALLEPTTRMLKHFVCLKSIILNLKCIIFTIQYSSIKQD